MAEIHVSKHALRRYLERVKGIAVPHADDGVALQSLRARGCDLGAAETAIRAIVAGAVASGASATRARGMRFVIKGQTVVTVHSGRRGIAPSPPWFPRAVCSTRKSA